MQGPKSLFRELDIKAPIRQQLANLVILEYPLIHVYLPSHDYDFEVIRDVIPHKAEFKESVCNNQPSPRGVIFREEEIEDDSSLDPQVLDLMKLVKPDPATSIVHQDKRAEKELNGKFDCLLSQSAPQGTKLVIKNDACSHSPRCMQSSFKTEDPGVLEDMDFDFEQGLIDAYSDLIAQTNPDDFLDLEGVFTEEAELVGRRDYPDFGGVIPVEEELEEGEIPGF